MKHLFLTLLGTTLLFNPGKGQAPVTFLCPPCGLDCDTIHFQQPGICPVCAMQLYASYPKYENRQGEHGDICTKKVAVVLFPGVEIIDFSGPWEIFGAAGMLVYSVAASDSVITTSMGLKIRPDYTFSTAPPPDVILAPGGNVNPSDTIIANWIRRTSRRADYTMSVCTGAFFLAAGGLLDSLNATTNYYAVPLLHNLAPTAMVTDTVRFIDNGRIITSSGLSAGIDAALHLVARYIGNAQTRKIANDLEYYWNDTDPFVRGKLADIHVRDFLNVLTPFDYTMTDYAGDRNRWLVSVKLTTDLNLDDLKRLLKTQFEQVSGWQPLSNDQNWTFDNHGNRWSASLTLAPAGPRLFITTLNVSNL